MATRLIEPLQVENADAVNDWIERIEQAIECQILQHGVIADNQPKAKVSFLLSNIGAAGYRILKSYCAPDLPSTKTFAQLKTILKDNLAPAPSPLSEGYAFANMRQEPGETLSMFMARLKDKANNCNFTTFYDRMVKDRFIYGLRNEKTRSNLLTKEGLDTSAQVLAQAISRENILAASQTMTVHSVKTPGKPNFHKFNNQNKANSNNANSQGKDNFNKNKQYPNNSNKREGVSCFKCTLRGHVAKDCRTKCRNCRGVGHIKVNCPRRNKTHNVEEVPVQQQEQEMYDYEVNHQVFVYSLSDLGQHDSTTSDQCDVLLSNSYDESSCFIGCGLNSYEDSSGSNLCIVNSDEESPGVDVYTDNSHEESFSTNCSEVEASNSHKESSSLSAEGNTNIVSSVRILNVDDACSVNRVKSVNVHEFQKFSDIYSEKNVDGKPIIKLTLNGKFVDFELDTGATITCISREKLDQLQLVGYRLIECFKPLCVANGQVVQVKHKAMVSVKYKGDSYGELGLHIVDTGFPTLLGRDWIKVLFGSDWLSKLVNSVSLPDAGECRKAFVEEMKSSPIFLPGIGDVKGYEAKLSLKPNARPKFCKARVPPFAIKDKVCDTLQKMVVDGRLSKVDHSEWASPIVPVVNPSDGSIRVCGDYKTTLNPALDTKTYPLPTVEECFASMVGGQLFTKIDIKQAYNSIRLREQDQILTTLNTQIGLVMWTRLPFGINSAGAQFQCTMDEVLLGISHTCCRVDDILVSGRSDQEHMVNAREVVTRLEKAGFKCRVDKTKFMQNSVVYLGHEVSARGIRPVQSKVETLVKAKYPENRTQLVSFLGAVQYYSRYIPNMSTVIEPLNGLRSAKVEWIFGKEQKQAFDELKKLLTSDRVLTFYDPDLPLKLDCDASSVGVGAVLSHILPNGEERPIEFISRTLTSAERRYSQIDREALAIIWSLKKFHKYVYARPFRLVTDHEPLQYIFHPHKGIPEMSVSRLQRWALMLSCYNYTIEYRPTGKHGNADVCSRFPLPNSEDDSESVDKEVVCTLSDSDIVSMLRDTVFEYTNSSTVFSVYIGDDKPLLNSELISKLSRTDPVLSKVIHYVLEGWPERPTTSRGQEVSGESSSDQLVCQRPTTSRGPEVSGESSSSLKAYFSRRSELSVDSGCLMWGSQVVIPEKMRKDILQLLHSTHMGSSSMKNMARRYLWWPGSDSDIENVSKHCSSCQNNQPYPKGSLPHPWNVPEHPWDRIHIDFAGPFGGSMWLLVVCAYSKWIEVVNMHSNTTAPNLIKKLREIFSRFGLPKVLVSDNGPQLSRSHEFNNFMLKNGIKYIPIPSYHAASNGQAEVMVRCFKSAMKKMCSSGQDINHNLANWLFQYRNTPHSSTGFEPAMLMFGRRPRTALSLLNPLSNNKQKDKFLEKHSKILESEKKPRTFEVGDPVLYRDVHNNKWVKGRVKSKKGSQVLLIESSDNLLLKKHVDHVVSDQVDVSDKEQKIGPTERWREAGENGSQPSKPVSNEHEHTAAPSPSKLGFSEHEAIAIPKPCLGQTSSRNSFSVPSGTDLESRPTVEPRPKREIKVPDRWSYTKLGGE